jgi:hypothetical protein
MAKINGESLIASGRVPNIKEIFFIEPYFIMKQCSATLSS